MQKQDSKSHKLHRKESVHRFTQKNRRFWRWFVKLNRLCLELGLEYKSEKGRCWAKLASGRFLKLLAINRI